MSIFHLKSKAVKLFWKYSVKIVEKSRTKRYQEKGKPLLGVLKATRYAGAIFIMKKV